MYIHIIHDGTLAREEATVPKTLTFTPDDGLFFVSCITYIYTRFDICTPHVRLAEEIERISQGIETRKLTRE